MAPEEPGYAKTAPNTAVGSRSEAGSPTTRSMPSGSALVRITWIVWGWQSASTKNAEADDLVDLRAIAMASAAAVPSSSIDAFAMSSPQRSATMVWKLTIASSRPWLISGW